MIKPNSSRRLYPFERLEVGGEPLIIQDKSWSKYISVRGCARAYGEQYGGKFKVSKIKSEIHVIKITN